MLHALSILYCIKENKTIQVYIVLIRVIPGCLVIAVIKRKIL